MVLSEVCSFRASGYLVTRCNIQITKTPELRFRAVLWQGNSGEVRVERATG
jgi:hypothetical protein